MVKTEILDKTKYKQIYIYTENIRRKMKIQNEIIIHLINSKYMTGEAKGKNHIGITVPLLNLYSSNINAIKLVICHELAHIKNKDTYFSSILKRIYWDLIQTKRSIAKSLLQELRADIVGADYSGLNNREIYSAHITIKEHNENLRKYTDYEYGYASREKRIKYSQKYNNINKESVYDILNDYCIDKNITDNEIFIESVVKYLKLDR